MNLAQATLGSDNSVYMQLALDLGPDAGQEDGADMGITTKLDGYPAESLGGLTIGVSPLEMANAYATIASGGVPQPADRDHEDPLPRRQGPTSRGASEAPSARRPSTTASPTRRRQILEDERRRRHRHARRRSAAPRPARPARPTNHRRLVRRLHAHALDRGLGRLSQAQVQMKPSTTAGPVAGGTFPAEIWGDYMQPSRAALRRLPQAFKALQVQPFFGKYCERWSGTGDVRRERLAASAFVPRPDGARTEPERGRRGPDGSGNDENRAATAAAAREAPTRTSTRRRRRRPRRPGGGDVDPGGGAAAPTG